MQFYFLLETAFIICITPLDKNTNVFSIWHISSEFVKSKQYSAKTV